MPNDSKPAQWPWAFFFATPFFTPNIFQAPTAIGLMAFATALFAAAWMHTSTTNTYKKTTAIEWLFLILCILPTSILLILDNLNSPWLAWKQSLYLTAAWLIYSMASSSSSDLLQSPKWAALLAIFAHLYIVYALLEAFNIHFFIPDEHSLFLIWLKQAANFPGPLMQRNMQSLFLVITISFLWWQIIQSRSYKIWGITTILPICGLLLTASRSGALVLIFSFFIIILLSKNKGRDLFYIICPAIFAWLIYTSILMQPIPAILSTPNIVERIESSGVLPRILVWNMSLNVFFNHPWFGVGWGNLPAHGMDSIAQVIDNKPFLSNTAATMPYGHVWAHNIVLQFMAEGGVFGASAIFIILIALAKQGWCWVIKKQSTDNGKVYGWLMSSIILLHGMVSISLMQPFFMALLALSLAACFSPASQNRQ